MSTRVLTEALQRVRRTLAGFTPGQKAVTAVAAVALLVGGVLFVRWAGAPTYAPAFTNLSATDAAAITQKLSESKTPYRLADGGQTVKVPQSAVYQTRITLAGDGLPAGDNSGYSLLDKQGLTTSDFQQHVTYQRALEGELAKTIEAIDGVQAAIVHLVVPAQDVFATDTSKPTASVLVKTDPGSSLTGTQVQAIVHLVSSSVEGMSPDDVTVASADGKVLNAAGDGGASAADDLHRQQTKAYEDATTQAVQSMLDQVVGPGHSVVRVQADLDFDQQSTTTEQYVTDKNAVPLTDSTSTETYTGNGSAPTGVLGPGNNGVPTGTGSNTSYTKKTDQRTNAVGKVTKQVKAAPGQVRRQSVAVVLDTRTAGAVDPAQINKLVSAAAGINATRGDTVQVSSMPFDTSAAAAAKKELDQAAAAKRTSSLWSLVRTGLIVLAVLAVIVLLLRRSRREERTPVELPPIPAQLSVDRVDELENADTAAELPGSPPLALDPARADEDRQRTAIRAEVADLIDQQPDEMARLLRGWLADRRS